MHRIENPAAPWGGANGAEKMMPINDGSSFFTKSPSLFQVQIALHSGAINEGLAALVVAAWARVHLGLEVTL
jgi:hypothetical protein